MPEQAGPLCRYRTQGHERVYPGDRVRCKHVQPDRLPVATGAPDSSLVERRDRDTATDELIADRREDDVVVTIRTLRSRGA